MTSDHYYTAQPASAHAPGLVTIFCGGRQLHCETDAGVFSKTRLDPGTALLLDALPEDLAGPVLDLGCGWGPVGLWVACQRPGARLTCCDINARALDLARRNFARNGLDATFVLGDGLDNVPETFAWVLTNPPIRAGKAVIYRLFAQARQRLLPGGSLYAVIRKQQGAPSALAYLRGLFGDARVVSRGGGYWVIRAGTPSV
ncbi:MAG: methyltransferase [Oscillospiraceae bacterium]|jgi:16S rRNA (guanine1207-N2)-methyltransferase|nr:methyltransferase [Oscillospiraceae bacterium]